MLMQDRGQEDAAVLHHYHHHHPYAAARQIGLPQQALSSIGRTVTTIAQRLATSCMSVSGHLPP
jgi:hypothetical protein